MMNKYIKIVMRPTPNGIGGSFNTFASFTLDNISAPKDQINNEYLQELENTFHIVSDIKANSLKVNCQTSV